MAETAKAHERRIRERFFERYLVGKGIDIGCGDDPVTPDCAQWDQAHGDAHAVTGGPYDWVYSSHCLEHLERPTIALRNWWSLVKPGGHLIVIVPHRDLYERKTSLPSIWNEDHKTFWLPTTGVAGSGTTWGLFETFDMATSGGGYELLRLTVEDTGWFYLPPEQHAPGEYSIEGIWRKPCA